MSDNVDTTMRRYEVEFEEKWREWLDKIPDIKFPSSWKVRIIPPFGGAMARFQVRTTGKKFVSVYLDCFERIGYFGEPYWEIYPYSGDVWRCKMKDTKKLIAAIARALKQQK